MMVMFVVLWGFGLFYFMFFGLFGFLRLVVARGDTVSVMVVGGTFDEDGAGSEGGVVIVGHPAACGGASGESYREKERQRQSCCLMDDPEGPKAEEIFHNIYWDDFCTFNAHACGRVQEKGEKRCVIFAKNKSVETFFTSIYKRREKGWERNLFIMSRNALQRKNARVGICLLDKVKCSKM